MNTMIMGVDLATKAIQVCVYSNSKVLSNRELTSQQFSEFLRQQSPCVVVFESCSGSNYWVQYCRSIGHQAKLISTRLVAQPYDRTRRQIKMTHSQLFKPRYYPRFILSQVKRLTNSKLRQFLGYANNLLNRKQQLKINWVVC